MKQEFKYDGINTEEERTGLDIMTVYCGICGRCKRAEANPFEDGKCPKKLVIRMVKDKPAYEVETVFEED